MAGEIVLHKIILNDLWPGNPNPNLGIPTGGWDYTGASGSACMTVPAYPPGTKIEAYSDFTERPGNYTMMYLCFIEGSEHIEDLGPISEGVGICSNSGADQAEGIAVLEGSYAGLLDYSEFASWICTNDFSESDCTKTGRVAIATADLSFGEFGWFWVGGVCPIKDATYFDQQTSYAGTEMLGETNIEAGSPLQPGNDQTGGIVLIPWDGTWEMPIAGYAVEADA